MTLLLTVSRSVFVCARQVHFQAAFKSAVTAHYSILVQTLCCTQSTMDSENVHPQKQPTLRPSLGKAQIEMRRVETTEQLLRKGDSASLLN